MTDGVYFTMALGHDFSYAMPTEVTFCPRIGGFCRNGGCGVVVVVQWRGVDDTERMVQHAALAHSRLHVVYDGKRGSRPLGCFLTRHDEHGWRLAGNERWMGGRGAGWRLAGNGRD